MTMSKLAAALAVLAATFSVSTMVAYAHSGEACVAEETEKCLDDDDFWACYDFIIEQCPSHDLPHAPADLNKLKLQVLPQGGSLVSPDDDSSTHRR